MPLRPLKVFLCHAHADSDPVRGLYTRLTKDGVDRYAWLDKAKHCGERSRIILSGQGFDTASPGQRREQIPSETEPTLPVA